MANRYAYLADDQLDDGSFTMSQKSRAGGKRTNQYAKRTDNCSNGTNKYADMKPVQKTPVKKTGDDVPEHNRVFREADSREGIRGTECPSQTYGPLTSEEYKEALKYVCEKEGLDDTDWGAGVEATNMIYDKCRIAQIKKPIYSSTLTEPVILNQDADSNNASIVDMESAGKYPLTYTIALVYEWQTDTGDWKSVTVSIMRTIEDFWQTINTLSGCSAGADSKFMSALKDKESQADSIFSSLISNGKKHYGDDDVVDITPNRNPRFASNQRGYNNVVDVRKLVSQYNALHPIWCFVKIDDKIADTITTKDNIQVPFVRENGRSINDITVNLKDTKANTALGIRPLDEDFKFGYIPMLVMDFVRGSKKLNNVSAITFGKTIVVNGTTYYKGYRLRVLVDDTKHLDKCNKYLGGKFISLWDTHLLAKKQPEEESFDSANRNISIARSVVRIILPK